MEICDTEIKQVLKSYVQPHNINDIELDRTVVILVHEHELSVM